MKFDFMDGIAAVLLTVMWVFDVYLFTINDLQSAIGIAVIATLVTINIVSTFLDKQKLNGKK